MNAIYGNGEWYNDQIALNKTINERKEAYNICRLDTDRWCAFHEKENGLFVATCMEEKLRGNYYHDLFNKEQEIIKRKRK